MLDVEHARKEVTMVEAGGFRCLGCVCEVSDSAIFFFAVWRRRTRAELSLEVRLTKVSEDNDAEGEKRKRTQYLTGGHRYQNRHRSRFEHRPHHQCQRREPRHTRTGQDSRIRSVFHGATASESGLVNGCANPWQPLLAQLTRPLRTSSSADL